MSLRPTENRFAACDKLLKAGVTGDGVNEALSVAVSDESNTSFLKIVIPNADVDHNGGHALSLAIKRCLPDHVSLLLDEKPNESSLNNAFDAAMSLSEAADQLKYCRMLLEAAAPETSASLALLKAVRAGRDDLCRLMLQYNASSDFKGGACLVTAVNEKNAKILTSLVEVSNPKPSKTSLEAAFKTALEVTDEQCQLELVQILLDAGVKGGPLHAALITQAKGGDKNTALVALILKYGASIDDQNGEALNTAAKLGAISLLQTMLQDRKVADLSLSRSVYPSPQMGVTLFSNLISILITSETDCDIITERSSRPISDVLSLSGYS
jgi:hypothetical protein